MAQYAELSCRSNYTFLTGASHPEELVERAAALGLTALAITDRDGVYGVVKAHLAARELGFKLLVGSELSFEDAPPLTLIARDLDGYKRLCRLITRGRTARPKGESSLPFRALDGGASEGLFAILREPAREAAGRAREIFGERFFIGLSRHLAAGDEARLQSALRLARGLEVPVVAVNDVHTHDPSRQPLQDVITCIREKVTLAEAGRRLFPNAERTLKSPQAMAERFADLPEALANGVALAQSCGFDLEQIAYRFPEEDIPAGHTPNSWLRELTWRGARERYGERVPEDVRAQLERELALIGELGYPGYFLTLWSVVQFARGRGILCQGRGSAANSAVCYCLGITAIDPVRMDLLFERFISRERNEPPDIDVDFEHERREEVLQHVYEKYGRERAAMVCEVISYRGRSALRDVGKALGLSLDQVDKLSGTVGRWGEPAIAENLREIGLDPEDRTLKLTLDLAAQIEGFPRHLGIHTGGFAITQGPIHEMVPVENATMEGRTVVQWDKDDLATAGVLKVDLLALGMLTAVAKCFVLVREHEGRALELATIPAEDPATYAMLCDADSVGVFQVESRAQMAMLPRLKPKTFYDLVVEVAIIRPGPIIGQMVHPYLRRRDGIEPVVYPHPVFEPILARTLGVTLFQEQVMRLAVAAAGFTLGEADALRRAMGHKRSYEKLMQLRERFIAGLGQLGLTREQGEAVFKQFEGFAHYGFPESHAASFALIAYASSYLKRHHPAAFACALLNAQPMGFYSAHTLLADARRHGVPALAIDVQYSDWDCTLERAPAAVAAARGAPGMSPHAPRGGEPFAIRLGMRMVRGLRSEAARALERARKEAGGPFRSLYDLWRRTHLSKAELSRLAAADALASLLPPGACSRREALWAVHALPADEGDLFARVDPPEEPAPALPPLDRRERVIADFQATGTCLEAHPMELLREGLARASVVRSDQVAKMRAGRTVRVAGMSIVRQRPETAKGMFFMTLEDEAGFTNIVATPDVFAQHRRVAATGVFLLVEGRVERSGKVVNVKAERFRELSLGDDVRMHSRDFH